MGEIHQAAARGFAKGADAYERGRPPYPPEAVGLLVQELGVGSASTVIDLGAGTGKLTRMLVPTGARLVAVEPVAAMREKLAQEVSHADVRDGTAERIPVPSASADAVVVAQAFHWFRHQEALAEIARVLRPGRGLALLWSSRDASVPWVERLNEIVGWNRGAIPTYDAGDERWFGVVAASGRFTPLQLREFRLEHEMNVERLLDRVASTSYVADMADAERAALLEQVRDLAADFPERFVLPYRTFVYWCRRR